MDAFISEGGRAKPGVRTVPIETIWQAMATQDADALAIVPHPGGAAIYRLFASSGTTGLPKIIAVSHDLMNGRVMSSWRNIGGSQAVHICAIGMGAEYGNTGVLRTLWSGGALVITGPDHIGEVIRRHGVTSIVSSPITLQRIVAGLSAGARPPPSLRSVEAGGGFLPMPLRTLLRQKLCGTVRCNYGSTETGALATASVDLLGDDTAVVGYIHSGVTVEAVDEADVPLPPGIEGILRFRSPNAVNVYDGDPGASAGIFRDGWFYNGDIGSVSPDGKLTVSGRSGDFINSGGAKIAARVIEDVLLSLPDVIEAAAFGVPDRMGVTQIWAAIVASTRIENAVLNKLCHEQLGAKRPKFILQIKGLPRNANGKVLKDELIRFAASQQR